MVKVLCALLVCLTLAAPAMAAPVPVMSEFSCTQVNGAAGVYTMQGVVTGWTNSGNVKVYIGGVAGNKGPLPIDEDGRFIVYVAVDPGTNGTVDAYATEGTATSNTRYDLLF
jgi:hypothetical protein